MIIIDKEKFDLLKDMRLKQRVYTEIDLDIVGRHMISAFIHSALKELSLFIEEEQVELAQKNTENSLVPGNYIELLAKFNVSPLVSLWGAVDEIVTLREEELNRRNPRLEAFNTYGQRIVYEPWGYDLERNVQIWKEN